MSPQPKNSNDTAAIPSHQPQPEEPYVSVLLGENEDVRHTKGAFSATQQIVNWLRAEGHDDLADRIAHEDEPFVESVRDTLRKFRAQAEIPVSAQLIALRDKIDRFLRGGEWVEERDQDIVSRLFGWRDELNIIVAALMSHPSEPAAPLDDLVDTIEAELFDVTSLQDIEREEVKRVLAEKLKPLLSAFVCHVQQCPQCQRAALSALSPSPQQLGADTPWSLSEVLKRLADAADHLLRDHNCDVHGWEGITVARDKARDYIKELASSLSPSVTPPPQITGSTSDGYHTFDELYEYRKAFNALLFNEWATLGRFDVHKAWRHSDGELCFGGGWFIVVAQTSEGQISNHYKTEDWSLFQIPERKQSAEYDGHTPQVALQRMLKLAAALSPEGPHQLSDDEIIALARGIEDVRAGRLCPHCGYNCTGKTVFCNPPTAGREREKEKPAL